MKFPFVILGNVAAAALSASLLAQSATPVHSTGASVGPQLGTIHFQASGSPETQARVVRGVKLLHHMMYMEADREFAAAAQASPDCAFAHWGRAMAIIHPLWPDAPTPEELTQGAAHVRAGLAHAGNARERAYLKALDTYYHDAAKRDLVTRLKAIDEGWAQVAREFPDDLDAAAFSALFHLAPARFLPKDKSHRVQLEAGAIVQKVLAKIPDHPGAQHYKIHAYDFPLLAGRALEICDSYGAIAPDVPHALHMPTHIFTRRGEWKKSIDFNLRSAEAAQRLDRTAGTMYMHYPHALDYLVYAYLQRGQYREADAIRKKVLAMSGPFHASNRSGMAFAFAAIPARYALERHAWPEAARLEVHAPASFTWGDSFPNCDSIVHFARGLGAARTGDVDAARASIDELTRLHRRIAATNPVSYWASQAETQLLTVRAWLQLKDGNHTEAIALMREAAKLEATADKEAVTPGEVLPARELLGDMLLEADNPGEALTAYEAVLESSPNRLNSLYGAGRAAELAGKSEVAGRYFQALRTVAAEADDGLERVQRAREFSASAAKKSAE